MLKKQYVLALSFSLLLASCTEHSSQMATPAEEDSVGPSGYYAVDSAGKAMTEDSLRKKIGNFFLVEQFNTQIFGSMKAAIKEHPPAGIVFWNPQGVGAEEIFRVNAEYSKVAEASGVLPLLLSTDYEGGALNQTLSGKTVSGIQRFVNGFTKLAHPAWLGKSMLTMNTTLCRLHGEIMAKEMKLAGFNYPLATVSDLSQNLFLNRGISKDPELIAACIQEILSAFHKEQGVTFVTKHFPGLGETVGDTHDQTVVSKAKTLPELQRSLRPFSQVITYSNENDMTNSYSILASHGKFDVLDPENITTVSKSILKDFLRNSLNYKGVVVSDAMWMGEYGHYSTDKLLVVYLKSVLAGMDMLMISGKTFVPAVQFFRSVYDDTTKAEVKSVLVAELKMDWGAIRAKFVERLQETSERLESLRRSYTYAHKIQSVENFQAPSKATEASRKLYYDSLSQLGMGLQ